MKVPAFIILPMLLFSSCKEHHNPRGNVAAVDDGSVAGIGFVEPVSELRRLAFRSSGIVSHCAVAVGQQVKKGELLMILDAKDEKAALNAAEAALALAKARRNQLLAGVTQARIAAQKAVVEAANAEAAFAEQDFARYSLMLSTPGTVSQGDHEKARTLFLTRAAMAKQARAELDHLLNVVTPEDRAVAEAEVERAKADVEMARARLDFTELRAPCDGTVLEILRHEGEASNPSANETAILFADLSRLRVRAECDETYALRLIPGLKAVLTFHDERNTAVEGRVTLVKQLMGAKTVFSHAATEHKDLDVRQVFIDLPAGVSLPVGLEVDVKIAGLEP